jgi:lipoprotein-anchoring transpeptidase ErfK/SrfK
MNWSVVFAPLVPAAWLAGIAAVLLVLLVPGFYRRMRGAWLRLAAAAALLLALANPVLLNEEREPLSTVVALVVDGSASQSLDGRDTATAAAAAELADRLSVFRGLDVRTVAAGGANGGPPVDGTELFGPLAAALADVPPERVGAVIMLTDGQVHDIPGDRAALPPAAPLHVLLSGHDGERDRRIVIDNAPRFAIVNELQTIRYRVIDDGPGAGGPVSVTVNRDGEPLAVETVTAGAPSELTIDIAHGGPNIIEFEAEPLDGELTPVNNRAVVAIEGIRENLRVLLVSGEPHAGERTWRNLLKSDAAVDLVHFTILRPPEKQDGTPINQLSLIAFPTRELFSEKIDQFDLIIFDRYQHRGVLPLLYFDNIARYVRNGGALLVAAGPDYAGSGSLFDTPLSPALPVAPTGRLIEEPYYARVTGLGGRHPVTRDLEGSASDPPGWSRFFRLVDVDAPEGNVIMSGAGEKPLLILNRQDEGRVALLLSDHAWLWARGYEGGGPHVDLLRRLAHWLMKEPDLEEEALRARASAGELIVEQQTMAEESSPVTVEKPSGGVETLDLAPAGPGLWRATMTADEIGLYRLEQGDKRAFAHVGAANPREFIDARSTAEALAPLVAETRGRIARMGDGTGRLDLPRIVPVRSSAAASGSDWIGVRMTEASTLRGISRVPLFFGFIGLFGIAGLFGLLALVGLPFATWLREGR